MKTSIVDEQNRCQHGTHMGSVCGQCDRYGHNHPRASAQTVCVLHGGKAHAGAQSCKFCREERSLLRS